MHNLNNRPTGLELDDAAEIARIYKRHQLARRVRRVSRIAIIAAKNDLSSKQRRALAWKRKYRQAAQQLRANQYRIAAACALVVFGISTIIPSFLQADTSKSVSLDKSVSSLIGETRDDANKYLTFDSKLSTYSFEVPETKDASTSEHTGRNVNAYSTQLPVSARSGITVTDTYTKIAVTLQPDFYLTPARKTDGNNIVYRSGNKQIIYTHKYNGLKEDIVLNQFQQSSMIFSFKLRLPSGVEARLDEEGNIGIYSSDPTLFGNISFDKDQDRQSVEKARENGAKTNLVMKIPYPIIKDSSGAEYSDRASFSLGEKQKVKGAVDTSKLPPELAKPSAGSTQLNEYTLTLKADNLKNLAYPISIDPTMQVRDAADFAKLNNDTNAEVDTTNSLIKRGSLTGGLGGVWTSNTNHLPYAAQKEASTIYNGYLYIHGGLTATGNDYRVYYAPINASDGSVGVFTPASAVVGAGRSTHAMFVYNGYMYLVGSGNSGNPVASPAALFAKVNTDGTVGTFTTSTSMQTGRRFASFTLSNGYIYVAGGCTAFASAIESGDCTSFASTVEYAQILPNGALSSWQTTSAFSGNRMLGVLTSYNGVLYFSGGEDDGDVLNNAVVFPDVFMARQNSNGTLNTWTAATSMPSGRNSHMSTIYHGYIYVSGGYTTVNYYAPIYADGSIGSWATNSALPFSDGVGVGVAYNNNLYLVGGVTPNTGDEILIAPIKPAGESLTYTPSGDFDSSGRMGIVSVAYGGYLYVTGGSSDYGVASFSNVIRKAAINADGTLGTWVATSNTFTKARYQHAAAIYNGYFYIWGGYGACGILGATDYCNDVQYSSIGSNGDLNGFSPSTNNMLVGRAAFSGVQYNGYLYVIGGRTSGGVQQDIDYAQIAADNTVGTWQNNPTSLSRPQDQHAADVSGGFIYLTGGRNGSLLYRDIQYAAINTSNGQIGSWSMVDPGDVGGWGSDKYGHAVWVYNGYLYQAGGCGAVDSGGSCTNGTNDLQYRKIQSDGSIASGAWTLASGGISGDFEIGIGWAVAANRLYIMGGVTGGSTMHKDIKKITLNNGGSGDLVAWNPSSSSLSSARGELSASVWNGYIYVIGGKTSLGDLSVVLYASVGADGTVGSWQSSATTGRNLPFTRSDHASVVHNGYLYVFEGNTTDTSRTRYAKLLSGGGIASDAGCGSVWCAAASAISNRISAPAAYWNGFVYLSGSCTTSYCTNVDYAKLLDTGGVASDSGCGSSWCSATSLSRGRSMHQMIAYAGKLYVIGGFTTVATPNFINTVEYAPINANGSIGSWTTAAVMPRQERNAQVTILNGYMYVMGGQYGSPGSGTGGTGVVKTTMFAPVLQSGALGSWSYTFAGYAQTRAPGAVVNIGSYVVAVGGDNAGSTKTYYTDVDVTSPQSLCRTTTFSKLYDFDVGVRPTKLITRGTKRTGAAIGVSYTSTNNTSTTLDNSQAITDTAFGGVNAQSINLGTNRTLSRYLFLRYTIDDSQSAVFPDSGNESTITDFDMYYTSNPGTRLRGGRTFTNGVDRGLEANPQ